MLNNKINTLYNITNEIWQEIPFMLENNGEVVSLEILYRPLVYSWFISKLTYRNYTIYNTKIVKSDNLFRQYDNLFPFRIIVSERPFFVEDFSNRKCKLSFYEV